MYLVILNHVIGPSSEFVDDFADEYSPGKPLDDLPDERIDLVEDRIDLDDIPAERIDLVEDRIDAIAVDRIDADLPDDCIDLADDCDLIDDLAEERIESLIDPLTDPRRLLLLWLWKLLLLFST